MKKSLLLIRHAQANIKESGENDRDRSLNDTGVMEALRIGRYLSKQEIIINQVIASYAKRAVETASLLSESLKLDVEKLIKMEELYEASARTLLDIINHIDGNFCCVILTGHNPALTFLGEYLSDQPIGFLPPAGIIWLEFDNLSWDEIDKGSATLKELVLPEQLTGL